MTSAIGDMLTDTSTLTLITTAVTTAAYSSYRANEVLIKDRYSSSSRRQSIPTLSDQLIDDNSHMLHGSTAMIFPVIAAISITVLFFFLSSIGIILTALSTISGFFAVAFVSWPLAHALYDRLAACASNSTVTLPTNRHSATTVVTAMSAIVALSVILAWLVTGNWLCNNIIGISLCVLFASLCKVSNLKVTVILFTGLFFYDIFFVFFSEQFFGSNVMVEVATAEPTNPASAIASWFNLPVSPVETLALPAKLIIPTANGTQAILGLGDIILPEILLAYLLQFDVQSSISPLYAGYFIPACFAYAFALLLSFFCNYAFLSAQPALLYIVPSVLLTTVALAIPRKHLATLWKGPETGSASLHRRYDEEDFEEDGVRHGRPPQHHGNDIEEGYEQSETMHNGEAHLLLDARGNANATLAHNV